jgi:hypothetical protein
MSDYKHYIRVENGIVIHGFTDAFEQPIAGDLLLSEQDGRHFQMPLLTDRMQYKYKIVNGQMVERTQEELDAEWAARPAPPPAESDRIKAVEDMLLEIMLGG